MAKALCFDQELRSELLEGATIMGKAVATTLGPKGHSVVLDRSFGAPKVSKDGLTIAEEIKLVTPNCNMAAQVLKSAADKTSKDAGDGTATAIVLTQEMFQQGLRQISAGNNPIVMFRGMQKAADAVIAHLEKQAKPLKDDATIRRVAAIGCNNDETAGAKIADVLKKIGPDGVFTVEEGNGTDDTVEIVHGMKFDRGFVSSHFVNNQEAGLCTLENPYIFLYEDKLTNLQALVPLLEKVAPTTRPLLLIADDFEGEALAGLVVNHINGIIKVCAVKAPGYGDRRKEIMGDIAALTKSRFFTKDLGEELADAALDTLGTAKKVVIDKDNCTIIDGAGDAKQIAQRIVQLRNTIAATTSEYDREKLQERLARLTGGVAKYMVGGYSETQMKERKSRVQRAFNSTRNAIAKGILPGGGVALVRAAQVIDNVTFASDDEQVGGQILQAALAKPFRTIIDNAGLTGSTVLHKTLANTNVNYGYNVITDQYGDMYEMGIADALKTVSAALLNATSCAGLLLTSEASIAASKDEDAGHGHGHDHGGDDYE